MSILPLSPTGSPRVTWATVVATTVGTGATPSPSPQELNDIITGTFMTRLREKDAEYKTQISEDLGEHNTIVARRLSIRHLHFIEEYTRIYNLKKIEVQEYRVCEIKRTIFHARTESELERHTEANIQRLQRLSPELSASDIAEIAESLDEKLAALTEEIVKDNSETNLKICEEFLRENSEEGFTSHLKSRVDQLEESNSQFHAAVISELASSVDLTLLLLDKSDSKFRAALASRIATEPGLSEAEKERMIKSRDQYRDRMVTPSRTKKSPICLMIESHHSQNDLILKLLQDSCVTCFGRLDHQFKKYYDNCASYCEHP